MCGFVGFVQNKRFLHAKQCLKEAVDLIEHRGPDDKGLWQFENVGLGFRRLAIQDLTQKSHQPMFDASRRYVIVFNGEIYNFKELRDSLRKKGKTFRTTGDTEVLLQLYIEKGKKCLDNVNGMFAFAIYDIRKKELFIARDRFGKKPLYYCQTETGFYFSSELKGLLPFVKRFNIPWEVNTDKLYEQFMFRFVSGEETLIKGVYKCQPGGFLVLKESKLLKGKYYNLAQIIEDIPVEIKARTEEVCVNDIKSLLQESVRLRMISDAPIGVALSGGVDSSLITFLMREIYKGPIRTYSVVFDDKMISGREVDESAYSDFVVKKCQTEHTKISLSEDLFQEYFLKSIWQNDEPLKFPNSVCLYLLSKEAEKKCKVLIGGEGADEAFAGYTFFKAKRPFSPLTFRFARSRDIHSLILTKKNLSQRKQYLDESKGERVNNKIYFAMSTYLQTILNRLDKTSMAASVEFRAPFLDYKLVEASLALPQSMRVQNGITKVVLKKLAERYLPHQQIYRNKVGFSVPLNKWLHNPKHLGRYVEILSEPRTLNREFYRKEGIKNLLDDFYHAKDTFCYSIAGRVWILLNFELWVRTFIEDKTDLSL